MKNDNETEKHSKRERYPLTLKFEILAQYIPHEMGYKQLARKYGVSRDNIRDWVHSDHLRKLYEAHKENE